MRRDVTRVGAGRLLLELALGMVLVEPMGDAARIAALVLALAASLVAHRWLAGRPRKAFYGAHAAMLGGAIGVHLPMPARELVLSAALGFAIELLHVDLVARRRISEHLTSFRVPSSLLVRRLGSCVVAAAAARFAPSVEAMGAHPSGLLPLLLALAAIALLSAGFGAGPSRPVTRPRDALAFLVLGALMLVPLERFWLPT
ncbi:MAG: hypothetical protein U0234_29390 [Sandaracinus sp.]